MRGFVFVLSLAVGALLATASATQAAAVQESVPVSFVVTNPCNGEAVVATGTAYFVTELDTNPTIQYVAAANARYDVTAVSTTTRASYVLQDVLHVSTMISSFSTFSPSQSTATQLFHLVSAGAAPDFWVLVVSRITVTANGDVVALFDVTPQACRG
jgi:hypothetical protein